MQVLHSFGDPSRDLGAALELALAAEPGDVIAMTDDPGPGARLQDLIVDEPLSVTVEETFDYWFAGISDDDDPNGAVAATLEHANESITPTKRLDGVGAAYWTDVTSKEYLRWVRTEDEDVLLDALARLHVAGEDRLVPGARLVGMFRAYGILVPVWDLEPGTGAEVLVDPAKGFEERLQAVLSDGADLTAEERAARAGLLNRQLTLR